MPRVSIVVPTYNRIHLLRETLPTLLSQTERDIEIVIVAGVSTDGTLDLVNKIKDTRVRLVCIDPAVPPLENWNKAIQAAQCKYIALYHDDDLYHPQIVERSKEFLDRHPNVGMVHVGAKRFTEGGRKLGLWQASRKDFVREGRKEAIRWVSEIHDVVPSSTMTRRTVYESVGKIHSDLMCGDFDLYVRIALVSDIGFIAGPLLNVRIHKLSNTNTMRPWRWVQEVEGLIPRFRQHFRDAGIEPMNGWDAIEKKLRKRFAFKLWQSGLTLLALGDHKNTTATREAALAIDKSMMSKIAGMMFFMLDRPTGSRLLHSVRSLRAAIRSQN